MPGQGEGQVAAGALGRILGVAQGLVGQAGADPVLVDGEPGAAGLLVASAQHTRSGGSEDGDGRGRPLHQLVAIGSHDERFGGRHARGHDQETHKNNPTQGQLRCNRGGSGATVWPVRTRSTTVLTATAATVPDTP